MGPGARTARMWWWGARLAETLAESSGRQRPRILVLPVPRVVGAPLVGFPARGVGVDRVGGAAGGRRWTPCWVLKEQASPVSPGGGWGPGSSVDQSDPGVGTAPVGGGGPGLVGLGLAVV
jgi:hypothetical protein